MKEAGVFSCSYASKERDFLIFSSQVKNWSTESLMFDFNSWPLTVRPGNGRMPTDESTPSRVPWTTCPWSILAVKEIKVMRMQNAWKCEEATFFFRNFRAIYRQFNMLFKEFFRISRFQPKSPKLSSQGNDPSSRSLSKAEPSLYHVQRPPCGTWWCEKWKGSKDRKSWIGNGEWMSPYQIWWALLYLTS